MIQRDYSNVSLYDYYFNRENEDAHNLANREVKLTDSGRTVYGGGGITPDVKIAQVKSNHFQDSLLQHYAFFNFAKHYAVTHHPAKSFEVDDVVLQDFRKFLDDEKVPYTEADLLENNAWVRSNIKSEIFVDVFGQEEGLKVRAETDPQVTKALELLPQAKQLAENARHDGSRARQRAPAEPVAIDVVTGVPARPADSRRLRKVKRAFPGAIRLQTTAVCLRDYKKARRLGPFPFGVETLLGGRGRPSLQILRGRDAGATGPPFLLVDLAG